MRVTATDDIGQVAVQMRSGCPIGHTLCQTSVRIGPEGWREFREVRLASLADSPGAFGARYADGVDAGEQHWPARPTDVPFTVVARSDGEPVGVACGAQSEDVVELISMWVARASAVRTLPADLSTGWLRGQRPADSGRA